MMRALAANNLLARREERALFVPINRALDPAGSRVAAAVIRVHRFASARGVCAASAQGSSKEGTMEG